MARQFYNTEYGQGTRGPNAPWFDQFDDKVPTSKLNEDDAILEDGSTMIGPDGQEYVVQKKKKPSLSDMAKDEAVSQVKKSAKEVAKQATGYNAGSALANVASEAPLYTAQGLAANPAANQAYNAAAMGGQAPLAEIAPVAESGFSLSGIGSAGNYILPAAGAYGLYDLYSNRPENIGHGSGYLQGAASGAALGSYFGPVGAVAGAGAGILANALGIGGKSRTKVEEERRQALAEQGINVPFSDVKEWEANEAFKNSRQESDLKGGDIENAASFYGITGYKDADQAKKEAIAQEAINRGLIREHHGTIDLSMTPEYQKYLEEQLAVPTSTGGGVDRRAMEADNKKRRKKAALDSIMPSIEAPTSSGPRYDINPGNLLNNPYL